MDWKLTCTLVHHWLPSCSSHPPFWPRPRHEESRQSVWWTGPQVSIYFGYLFIYSKLDLYCGVFYFFFPSASSLFSCTAHALVRVLSVIATRGIALYTLFLNSQFAFCMFIFVCSDQHGVTSFTLSALFSLILVCVVFEFSTFWLLMYLVILPLGLLLHYHFAAVGCLSL